MRAPETMKLSTTPLPSAEYELACDEVLLDNCDRGEGPEVLRLWEPQTHFVVLGYANSVERETNQEFCALTGIPILRRCTGGGTVLQGPGCLNYSLILHITEEEHFSTINSTNRHIMGRHQQIAERLTGLPVRVEGHTDLAILGLKFSGNAQRRKLRALLFHGCFLLRADISLIEQALRMPSKQPGYRQNRSHREFLTNLPIPADTLREHLIQSWRPTEDLAVLPLGEIERLARTKYGRPEWNLKL